jgi:hypothetical protein
MMGADIGKSEKRIVQSSFMRSSLEPGELKRGTAER